MCSPTSRAFIFYKNLRIRKSLTTLPDLWVIGFNTFLFIFFCNDPLNFIIYSPRESRLSDKRIWFVVRDVREENENEVGPTASFSLMRLRSELMTFANGISHAR